MAPHLLTLTYSSLFHTNQSKTIKKLKISKTRPGPSPLVPLPGLVPLTHPHIFAFSKSPKVTHHPLNKSNPLCVSLPPLSAAVCTQIQDQRTRRARPKSSPAMSQPPPLPSSSPNHLLHQIPIKIAARKLPVKRKTPDPNPNPNLPGIPKSEISSPPSSSDPDEEDDDLKPPPFKFHRIWSESDELRLLQGLLDSSADGLSFPRDLNLFFDRFSQSMPQPYTKSQLSEKLRRLKKKFRVISARLSRGLDASHLTPHDRSLLHLSKQLWHPAFAASSPFSSSSSSSAKKKSTFSSSRVRVTPSPAAATATTSSPSPTPPPPPPPYNHDGGDLNNNGEEDFQSGSSSGIGHVAAKTVMDVFDQSLSGVRMVLARHGLLRLNGADQGKARDLANKWREQRVAELDVLARRLRLVLEHAVRE